MIDFPTDTPNGPLVQLPIVVHLTYPLAAKALTQLAPLLKIHPRVLANNYEHHATGTLPCLFTCSPYSFLDAPPGGYAIGITALSLTLLRYGAPRTEHLTALNDAALGVGKGLMPKHGWPDGVKEAYRLMRETAIQVHTHVAPAPSKQLRPRLSYQVFTEPAAFFAVYELQAH